jgi:hypothetical protein
MRAEPKVSAHGLSTVPASASPLNGIVEIAPDQFRPDELIHKALSARNDPRDVTTDPHASYLGIVPSEAPSSSDTAHSSSRPDSPTGSLLADSAAPSRA